MKFLRRMTTKAARSIAPELCDMFKDKKERPNLFRDFFKAKGNLEEMKLLVTRRSTERKKAKDLYRPKTRAQLMEKYNNDEAYVELVVQNAIRTAGPAPHR